LPKGEPNFAVFLPLGTQREALSAMLSGESGKVVLSLD